MWPVPFESSSWYLAGKQRRLVLQEPLHDQTRRHRQELEQPPIQERGVESGTEILQPDSIFWLPIFGMRPIWVALLPWQTVFTPSQTRALSSQATSCLLKIQCYNSVEKLAKTQIVETMRDTDRLSAAVLAYVLGHQFALSVKIWRWSVRNFWTSVSLLIANLGRKVLNVLKFVKNRFLEQITNKQ